MLKERPVALQRDLKLEEPPNRWRHKKTLARAISVALLGASSLGATGAMAAEPDFFAGDSYSLILRDDGVLIQMGGNPDVPRIEPLPEPFTFSLSKDTIFTGVDSISSSDANSVSNSYAAVSIDKEALVWCPSEKCANEITAPPTPITGSHITKERA